MTAIIQTLATPDGAFTLFVDERQRVLASGWTDDHAAIVADACRRIYGLLATDPGTPNADDLR